MKKLKKILMIVFLMPILLLASCSDPSSFVITASPSDRILGTVRGAIDGAVTEGNKVTLTAYENANTANTNPFLCWIQNQSFVVSTDRSIELTYNAQSAGNYTALFAEQDLSKMMYAAPSTIEINSQLEVQTINFSLQYARSTSSSDFHNLISSSFANGTPFQSDYKNVLYLGNALSSYSYIIRLEISLVYNDGSTSSPYIVEFDNEVIRNSFDSSGNLAISEYDTVTASTVTVTFTKLHTSLFAN